MRSFPLHGHQPFRADIAFFNLTKGELLFSIISRRSGGFDGIIYFSQEFVNNEFFFQVFFLS